MYISAENTKIICPSPEQSAEYMTHRISNFPTAFSVRINSAYESRCFTFLTNVRISTYWTMRHMQSLPWQKFSLTNGPYTNTNICHQLLSLFSLLKNLVDSLFHSKPKSSRRKSIVSIQPVIPPKTNITRQPRKSKIPNNPNMIQPKRNTPACPR